MEKKKLTVLVVLIVIAVLGYFGWQSLRQGEVDLSEEEINELNPFVRKETANPFQESVNPYENIKTNPFE